MVTAVYDGISRALADRFPAYPVYGDEPVSQGLKTPCFFVGLREWAPAPLPCGLIRARLPVAVTYFPSRKGGYPEMWAVGPAVLDVMEKLELPGGAVRGTGLQCAVADGLMHIQAVYQLRMLPERTRPLSMDGITVRTVLGAE